MSQRATPQAPIVNSATAPLAYACFVLRSSDRDAYAHTSAYADAYAAAGSGSVVSTVEIHPVRAGQYGEFEPHEYAGSWQGRARRGLR